MNLFFSLNNIILIILSIINLSYSQTSQKELNLNVTDTNNNSSLLIEKIQVNSVENSSSLYFNE